MRRIGVISCGLVLCGLFNAHSWAAQGGKGEGGRGGNVSGLVGDWSGESVCADRKKFPACKDEQVVYRVALTNGKADTVTITMDKLVAGRPETMGVQDFVYDARRGTLTSEFKNPRVHLALEFNVKGDLIEGIIATLPDRAVARRIKVKKEE